MAGTGLAYGKSSIHETVLTLIPQAFPEQQPWARTLLKVGRQRNLTLNGQSCGPQPGGETASKTMLPGKVMSSLKREQSCAQMQTTFDAELGPEEMLQSYPRQTWREALTGAKARHNMRGPVSIHTAAQPCLLFVCFLSVWFILNPRPDTTVDSTVDFGKPELMSHPKVNLGNHNDYRCQAVQSLASQDISSIFHSPSCKMETIILLSW